MSVKEGQRSLKSGDHNHSPLNNGLEMGNGTNPSTVLYACITPDLKSDSSWNKISSQLVIRKVCKINPDRSRCSGFFLGKREKKGKVFFLRVHLGLELKYF